MDESQLPLLTQSVLTIAGKTIKILHPKYQEGKYSHLSQGGLWAPIWGSSLILAEILSFLKLSGLKVLEIGAGMGLTSIAAALSGATQVYLTDYAKEAVLIGKKNAGIES